MWPGFDGRAYSREQWIAHVADMDTFPGARGVVEHATGIPTLAESLKFSETDYLKNTQVYYENQLGWAHGPHGFATFKHICGFSALNVRGTHCSCQNFTHYGFEAMGNRGVEDFTTGPGKDVLDNQHFALATMFVKMGIKPSPETYLPHSACKRDGHSVCPTPNWEADFRESETASIVAFMNAIGGKLVSNPALVSQAIPLTKPGTPPAVGSVAWIQAALDKAGASPQIDVDGDFGPATKAAVWAFQAARHLTVDGDPGSQTIGALKLYA